MAASVRTRVVSWKDAAERNDSVASEALVTPSSTGSAVAGFFAVLAQAFVGFVERRRFDQLTREQARVAAVDDLHLAQHRAHDDFDVLVVDVDALRAVDLLHFLHQVVLQRGLALDPQDVVRVERAFVELVAGLDLGCPRAPPDACRSGTSYSCSSPVASVTIDDALVFSSPNLHGAGDFGDRALGPWACALRRFPRRAGDP